MDHAEAIESGGHTPQNELADDPSTRGNSTKPTLESMADGDEVIDMDIDVVADLAAAHDEGIGSMEVDAVILEAGTTDVLVNDEANSLSALEPADLSPTPLLSLSTTKTKPPVASPNDVECLGTGRNEAEQQMPSDETDATRREPDPEVSWDDGPPAAVPVGEPVTSSEAITNSEQPSKAYESDRQLSSNPIGSLSIEQRSFEIGPDISVDEEDNDILSDKASSTDAQSESDADPIPQDRKQAGQRSSERAPLENTYGPFIHPTDTCLADARERLQVALEQTRLLRASFTGQAYERYRCVMKPVPESFLSDSNHARVELREQADAIKVEKDMEKKQAHQAGVGLEELAYFGEGLHLVYLPEDDVDENEIDLVQFPHRGPTDPQTGERREEISAAAAATTEQVFDRIRRIRAIRMGADITEAGTAQATAAHLAKNHSQDQQTLNESFSPGLTGSAHLSLSPAPSVDSNAGVGSHSSTKNHLQHLLTLAPEAEGARPDGSFTAVQSALIARGVGMHEMKRDFRINPLRQRIVQPNYFSPTPSYKFLPPLLGPHQLYRLQAADARWEGLESRSGARDSIKSVVEEICSKLGDAGGAKSTRKSVIEGEVGTRGSGNIRKALCEERSAEAIGLLWRMHSAMLKNQRDTQIPAPSDAASSTVGETTNPPGIQTSCYDLDTGDFDPLLAFSVMSAVGLVRKKEGDSRNLMDIPRLHQNHENSYARALGLDRLAGLESISQFFHTNPTTGKGRKRQLSGSDGEIGGTKKSKTVKCSNTENQGSNDAAVYQIRGGGGQDEANAIEPNNASKETGAMRKQKNGVSKAKNQTDVPASYEPMYNAMSQVPLGDKQSQSVIAAAASRQLLQHQLGVRPDPYHPATLAHQLTMPMGSHLHSFPTSDLSEFYLRNGLAAGNPDWQAIQTSNPAIRADILTQHQQLTPTLGLLPGQMNLSLPEHERARAMLLRDHHNAAAARAHGAVTAAAAARYQAALSSINPQNQFGFVASSHSSGLHSNEMQSISSMPASHAKQQKGPSSKTASRKRSLSSSERKSQTKSDEENNENDEGKPDETTVDVKRPASVPPSPSNSELNSPIPNGGTSTGISKKTNVSGNASPTEQTFTVPNPPKGLRKEIADLIANAKFHEAHSLSQIKCDEFGELSIQFLLSLGEAVPIQKELIANPLVKRLNSSNYQLRLHEFVGNSISASSWRNVIIAIISIWLWAEHKDCFNQAVVESGNDETNPSYKWIINLAIDKSLSAIATFFDSHPSAKGDGPTEKNPTEQVAAIASKTLTEQVFVDHRADVSFPILEDLLKLLDSLRTDALRAKTQERVLVAALTSRCGNMSEAFSNAYVSSIVRAGVALGHEHICEIGQDEGCRASTMLPYDFFHDNFGVWEEPCRPTTGYHPDVGGNELTKQAHARSLIQKSMKRLQNSLGLKGGISDGGPYFPVPSANTSAPPTPTVGLPLVRTPSGSLKRRGSYDALGAPGAGPQETTFNPDHYVTPMLWNSNDVGNSPYGQHQLEDKSIGSMTSEKKKRETDHINDGDQGDQTASFAEQYRSTQELEWEDVANMFFHGGSTRNIDINYDFGSNHHLGRKKIIAPFVKEFDCSTLIPKSETENESLSDEDISDDAVFRRHQDSLDEMKLKLDAALESRKQPSQGRGRKR
eukprot:CAMPEP_0181128302 /NCGR_PEP_ID=MMETSP1071-20121207/28680_1 /TAXON_ID=35127 /ORGANISM="Thalassiosira sp., Strain NH16" /LENGTH=1655 /DNA_ID=CAMNT_0023214141 /DNA_START=106 /DNA_END=5073 /DNA_ORIENTATION=+